jgi:mannose/fructose/N-acetylgalactosamine-specific phosphotransferase system component IIC
VAWPGGCGRWKAAASRRLISGTVSGIIPGVFQRSLVSGGGWRGLGIGTVFEQAAVTVQVARAAMTSTIWRVIAAGRPGLWQLPVPFPGSLANQRHAVGRLKIISAGLGCEPLQ